MSHRVAPSIALLGLAALVAAGCGTAGSAAQPLRPLLYLLGGEAEMKLAWADWQVQAAPDARSTPDSSTTPPRCSG